MRSGTWSLAGGSVAVTVCRTVWSGTPCATIALAASASGSFSSPRTRCPGQISLLPAARASFCAASLVDEVADEVVSDVAEVIRGDDRVGKLFENVGVHLLD